MVSAASPSNHQFQELMINVPENGIVLLEDVDCLFVGRSSEDKKTTLSFSGFLNAIDGIASPQGRILIMTTNHIEKLDGALLRPGRCDHKCYMGNATLDQAKRLFERFFPYHGSLSGEFADCVGSAKEEVSMAQLQEIIVSNHDDPNAALDSAKTLMEDQNDNFNHAEVIKSTKVA